MIAALLLAAAVAAPTPAPPSSPEASAPAAGMSAPLAPETCPARPPALPAAMEGWTARTALAAATSPAGLDAAALTVGRGVDASLRPAAAVTYAAPPGKPAGPRAQAGLLSLRVAAPGTYAVGLSSAAWIDVVDAQGASAASTAHGHGPPCSGMRKVVDFPLEPGRYVVQLTADGDASVGVLVFPR